MRCDEFQDRWQRLLDDRQLPEQDDLLCAHAAICSDCDEFLRVQTILFCELARYPRANRSDAKPSKSTSNGARFDLPGSRRRSIVLGLAIAGSMLVVLVPSVMLTLNRQRDRVDNRPVASSRTPSLHTALVVKAPATRSVPRRNRAESGDANLEKEALRKLVQDVAAKLSDVPEEQLEPLDRIAGGFRPLANTLGVAWDALRRTIPVKRTQSLQEPQAIHGWHDLQGSQV